MNEAQDEPEKWPLYMCVPLEEPHDMGKTGLWHPNEEHVMAYLVACRIGFGRSAGRGAFRAHIVENVYTAMVNAHHLGMNDVR